MKPLIKKIELCDKHYIGIYIGTILYNYGRRFDNGDEARLPANY